MYVRDRIGDKNWECYDDEVEKGVYKCGNGKVVELYLVASHEKAP